MKRRNFLRSIIAAVVASPILARFCKTEEWVAPNFKDTESKVEMVQIGAHLWRNEETGRITFDALFDFMEINAASALSASWTP